MRPPSTQKGELTRIIFTLLSIPAIFIVLHTLVRIVRAFYKFPMPQWMANLIDNPLRRKIQPPEETAIRHGIMPGMRVLEVGPGNGTYTLASALPGRARRRNCRHRH